MSRHAKLRCESKLLRACVALIVVAGALCCPRDAHADLMRDASVLVEGYRRAGAKVRRAAPWFMIRDEVRPLGARVLPPEKGRGCVAVVALAERNVSFRFVAKGPLARLDAPHVRESEAGVARIDDCRGRLTPASVRLLMTSARGAVELLVLHYDKRMPEVEELLPERAVGPKAPRAQLGEPPELAPVQQRLARAEDAARQDGSGAVVRVATRADDGGTGAMIVKLSAGCHRVSVHADAPADGGPVDVDAEVMHRGRDEAMARDRSHAPDARLEFCLGEAEPVELRFVGAGGAVEVHVVDAHWPLPEGVPTRWGKEVRARIAWAMFRRHAPMVVGPPLLEALGSSGVTQLPVVVESGACYLAAYALTRGEPSSGRLTLRSGTVVRHDDAETSASVSFCAGPDARNATFEVGLAASQAWWVLALWRLSGAPSVHGAGGERP